MKHYSAYRSIALTLHVEGRSGLGTGAGILRSGFLW
jgi:hypothetical protein